MFAVALLLGVLGLVYLAVIGPLLDVAGEYAESVEDLEFRLQRYRKLIAEKPIWQRRLEEIRQQGAASEQYISRDTPPLASAELQALIKDTINSSGGELISTQVIPERQEEQLTRIAVKVRMNGNTRVLREVLYAIETAKPILLVENLNLRPIRGPLRPGGKIPADRLSIDFDVIGYMRAG